LAASLLTAGVLAGIAILYFYVEITMVFEGRLWDVPSRVYSDRLSLKSGTPVSAEALARRLDRCAYGRVDTAPTRPGQYRRRGGQIELVPRPGFGAPPAPPRRVRVRFDGSRVDTIEDAAGRHVGQIDLEPELLALLAGPQQEEREIVRLDQVPRPLVQAVLAAEDSRFYSHPGVDPIAILRAALADILSGKIVQGGSTITQQTVKNLYLGQERTWWRKAREMIMAVILDLRYSKDRILEVYLNEVYLGQRGAVSICGIASAARFYFGRDLRDLSLGESALLAGLIRNPGGLSPFGRPDAALARRGQVVDAMKELGYLDAARADTAKREPLRLASGLEGRSRSPYVVDFVRAQLGDEFDPATLAKEGLRIYTTIDTIVQDAAQAALTEGLARLDRDLGRRRRRAGGRPLEGCVLVLQPHTGSILAMVGGRDYRASQFNRAVQARRQPGSCFKPFVYLAGFEAAVEGKPASLTPATPLDDEPLELTAGGRAWHPSNYDGQFRGPVSARRALEESLNVPTVRAALKVGLSEIVAVAGRCGIPGLQPYPSLALGAQDVTPLQLATAYGVLANGGLRVNPSILKEVTTREGERLQRRRTEAVQAVSPQAAFLCTDVLRGVLLRGTAASASELGFRGTAAGKTGTTDDTRDAWFIGYTPELLALVWVGHDDDTKTGLTGASGALPIWVDLMSRAGRWSYEAFTEPDGLVRVVIDPETGQRAVGRCPASLEEIFPEASAPEQACEAHDRGISRWFRRLFGKSH
jgi:penicillin-binding protein 1B